MVGYFLFELGRGLVMAVVVVVAILAARRAMTLAHDSLRIHHARRHAHRRCGYLTDQHIRDQRGVSRWQ